MRPSRLRWILEAVCLSMFAQPMAAQVVDSTQTDLRTVVGIADNRHWSVRVETVDGTQFEGNVTHVPGDAVRVGSVFAPHSDPRSVPAGDRGQRK